MDSVKKKKNKQIKQALRTYMYNMHVGPMYQAVVFYLWFILFSCDLIFLIK